MNIAVRKISLDYIATGANFNESKYLASNPDVKAAVAGGMFSSGREHFERFGKKEGRKIRDADLIADLRREKSSKVYKIIKKDMPHTIHSDKFNFLTESLKEQFNIVDTENISANDYDPVVLELIEEKKAGLILDCGAGRRGVYYQNVVNYEIVDYDTTDVIGVGERLPFQNNCFDGVISIAVLEHVKDPFACAKEMARVLKPGGKLICCAPFLQPLHGYPHHYYNMSHQGLKNLFENYLTVDRQDVIASTLPIWSLSWFLSSWSQGLPPEACEDFLNMRVKDFIGNPISMLDKPFVKCLSGEKNFELASATVIFARKP